MHDPFKVVPASGRPPGNVHNLRSRLTRYAQEHGLNVKRLNQRLFTEVMFGLLERAKANGVIPMYLAKGGMALELRFGIRARASGDLDLGIVTGSGDLLSTFDRVLETGFHDFIFTRRGEPRVLENSQTYRLEVKIAYRGGDFGTLNVDLNEASFETATDVCTTGVLTALGLPGPLHVPLLDPYIQISHKLHGATEPDRDDYTNLRYRDLLDVLVMAGDPSVELDLSRLRATVVKEFSRRKHHRHWPPVFTLPAGWREELSREAVAIGFLTTDSDELGREFVAFIARIEGIKVKPDYHYDFVPLQINLTGDRVLTEEAQRKLDALSADGWKILWIGPRPGYSDQFLAIIEKPIAGNRNDGLLPRLQLRIRTQYGGNNEVSLTGLLRNETAIPANRVRVFASNVEHVVRLGTLTQGDGEFTVQLPYGNAALRTQRPQMAGIIVQYATDDGIKVEQTGILTASPEDASGRFTYEGDGLGPSRVIEQFTVRHDSLE